MWRLSRDAMWMTPGSPHRALATTLLGGIASQLTLVATGVILARALGPENRGHLALLILIGFLAGQFGGMGIQFALTQGVARAPGRALEILAATKRAMGVRIMAATALAAALLAALTAGRPAYIQEGAVVVALAVAPATLQQCGLGVLQGLRRFGSFNLLRIGPNAAFGAAGITLLLVGHAGFTELTLAWGISLALFASVTMRKARSESERLHDEDAPPPPSTSWILGFGRRSMIGASPPIETYRLDQFIVALFLPPTSLGVYVVALAFTNLPRFITQSVGLVANPLVASCETHDQARRRMWLFALAAIPLFLPVVAAIWVAVPLLTDFFFGSSFADAAPVTRLLLIATSLYCARRVLTDAARGAGYPMAGTVAELVASIAAIPCFAFFVPASGLHGAAYALIASSTVALAVMVGMLVHSGARRSIPSGWSETGVGEGSSGAPDSARRDAPLAGQATAISSPA